MEETKKFAELKKSKVKDSEVEIEVSILPGVLFEHKNKTLAEIKKDFAMPGFRKGMVPENVILKNIHAGHLLQDAAESAIREVYPLILNEAEIEPITPPAISIVKLAEGNPLELKIKVGVYPEIKLPNYKKIAKSVWDKKEAAEVEDKEVEDVIAQLLRMRQVEGGKDAPVELTDEEVKKFGEFANVADFKTKLRENLKEEKSADAVKRAHDQMVREIVEDAKVELPPILVDMDYAEFHQEFLERLKETNETLEKFLEKTKKKAEDVEKEQREYIEKSLKTKFVLSEILKLENLSADPDEVEIEAIRIKNYRPDMDEKSARSYAESMLLNELMFAMLEGRELKKKEEAVPAVAEEIAEPAEETKIETAEEK